MITKRAKRIVIRTTADEHRELSGKARAAGLTVSALVRQHCGRLRVYNYADREMMLRSAVALRQAAATMARAAKALSPLEAVAALAYLSAINRHLREILAAVPKHAPKVLPSRGRGS